jgi:hypothetical protein
MCAGYSLELGSLKLFIKDYVLASAAGAVGPMVLIVADESLEDGVIKSEKLVGLSHSADPLAEGWLVFLRTRAGTSDFFSFYLREILIPYVSSVRAAQGLDGVHVFFSVDGEPKCINTWTTPDCVKLLDDASILLAKHSASYSARGNALDAGNAFKSTKNYQKYLSADEVSQQTPDLRRRLDGHFDSHMKHWKKARRDFTVDAICRVVLSSQSAMTPSTIRNGFARTGQYVKGGMDFDTKIRNCTYPLSQPELKTIRTAFPALTKLMQDQGYVTEQQMDDCGIPRITEKRPRKKAKDERVIWQQRALLVNIPKNLERFTNPPAKLTPLDRASLAGVKKAEKASIKKQLLAKSHKATLLPQPSNAGSIKAHGAPKKRKQPATPSGKENGAAAPQPKRTKTREVHRPKRF